MIFPWMKSNQGYFPKILTPSASVRQGRQCGRVLNISFTHIWSLRPFEINKNLAQLGSCGPTGRSEEATGRPTRVLGRQKERSHARCIPAFSWETLLRTCNM